MPLHFSEDELAARRAETCRLLAEAELDGLLIFRQESMYYLTGYDTFGYCFVQCLYLGADGKLVLLTRAPDMRQCLGPALPLRQTHGLAMDIDLDRGGSPPSGGISAKPARPTPLTSAVETDNHD